LAATVRGYDLGRRVSQCAKRQEGEPERERARRERNHGKARLVSCGISCRRGNARQHKRQNQKERAKRSSLRRRSHAGMLVAWPATFADPRPDPGSGNITGQPTQGARLQSLAQPRGA